MLTAIDRIAASTTCHQPLRVAVLTSHRAPGLVDVWRHRSHGRLYSIVGIVSSEEACADTPSALGAGIPVVNRPIREFHRACGRPLSDMLVREAYDRQLATLLTTWHADVVLCCSYLFVLTPSFLAQWPDTVFNLHHSDMLDRTANGRVRYPGLHAVRDAVFDGATETRATVHLVTPDLDDGPAILRSWRFPIAPLVSDARKWGETNVLKAYAFAHQEWMIRSTWGPLMRRALELAALDRRGLAAGQLLGAPWELTESGRLISLVEQSTAGRRMQQLAFGGSYV